LLGAHLAHCQRPARRLAEAPPERSQAKVALRRPSRFLEAQSSLVGGPVFKTGEGGEKLPWWVRFPCASANFMAGLYPPLFTPDVGAIPPIFPPPYVPSSKNRLKINRLRLKRPSASTLLNKPHINNSELPGKGEKRIQFMTIEWQH